jgi:hypothetical protein
MKLKFIHSDGLDKNLKATAHKTGKLGFTIEAAKKMALSADKSLGIAINEDEPSDKNLYVIVHPGTPSGAFKISKAGEYYYIQAKALFVSLKIDYIKESAVYDIYEDIIEDSRIFVFKRREKSKKPNDNI